MLKTLVRVAALPAGLLAGSGAFADPANWSCSKQSRDGAAFYACRDCGPPQAAADGLQICQVYDFRLGVEAHEATGGTELVIVVTPYLVQPAQPATVLRPPDRFELRRPAALKP